MITNPHVGQNIVLTTPFPHGLRNGFFVSISGVLGRKTDSSFPDKTQVDENGTFAGPDSGLIIKSAANGSYEITNVTPDSFELKGKSGNSDYINNGTGKWSTGTGGSGYMSNAYALFVGGGGYGARVLPRFQEAR